MDLPSGPEKPIRTPQLFKLGKNLDEDLPREIVHSGWPRVNSTYLSQIQNIY